TASMIDWRLLPRPEMRTPSRRRGRESPLPLDVAHRPLAGDDEAESECIRLARHVRHVDDPLRVARGAHDDEADAHVERAEHLLPRNAATLLEQPEDRRNRPPLQIDVGGAP